MRDIFFIYFFQEICTVDPELKAKLTKFRFRKSQTNAAIISEYLGGATVQVHWNLNTEFELTVQNSWKFIVTIPVRKPLTERVFVKLG